MNQFHKKLGSSGPGGKGSKALQEYILKFGKDSKNICISFNFFNWLFNKITTWAAYRAFISVCPIALDKHMVVCLVGVGVTWRHIFSKCVLNLMGPKDTNACEYNQMCARLNS